MTLKKTLVGFLTALTVACSYGKSQVHYSMNASDPSLAGVKVQTSTNSHTVGFEAHYGRDKGTSALTTSLPFVGDISIQNGEPHRLQASGFIERELYSYHFCDYFSAGISLGAGYQLRFRLVQSDYTVLEKKIDDFPSSLSVNGNFYAKIKPEVKIWHFPIHYSFQLNDALELSHFVSMGYEF